MVRVQVPAGRAAGDPAAPAVALEDPVAPPPCRVPLDVPGLFERVDHPDDALPVVQIAPRRETADPQGVTPEEGDVIRSPEADARAATRTHLHLRSGVHRGRGQPGPGRLEADRTGRIERRRAAAAPGAKACPVSRIVES